MIDQLTGWIVGGVTYTNNGIILHTINGGETWNVQALDTIPHLRSCTFLDEYNGWAVGDYGTILHTSNGGQTWENQESGVLANLLGVFFIDQNNGWICGDSAIVLHTDNGGIVGVKENYIRKIKSHIYPNPSKGLATITYELYQKELITMSILNIRGQEVKQISLGKVEKGQFELDCSKFSPGIYFIHLQTEKEILTEKLIIE